jgi:hypothetical protein
MLLHLRYAFGLIFPKQKNFSIFLFFIVIYIGFVWSRFFLRGLNELGFAGKRGIMGSGCL